MAWYGIIVLFIYGGLGIYILPKDRLEFDLYRIKFTLFPHWFVFVSLAWFLISVITILTFADSIENYKEYLISALNLSLFIIIFSKQKKEDEFSEITRLKSFAFSFLMFVINVGAFGAMDTYKNSTFLNTFNLHLMVGASMLISLLYFYVTLYKIKKQQ